MLNLSSIKHIMSRFIFLITVLMSIPDFCFSTYQYLPIPTNIGEEYIQSPFFLYADVETYEKELSSYAKEEHDSSMEQFLLNVVRIIQNEDSAALKELVAKDSPISETGLRIYMGGAHRALVKDKPILIHDRIDIGNDHYFSLSSKESKTYYTLILRDLFDKEWGVALQVNDLMYQIISYRNRYPYFDKDGSISLNHKISLPYKGEEQYNHLAYLSFHGEPLRIPLNNHNDSDVLNSQYQPIVVFMRTSLNQLSSLRTFSEPIGFVDSNTQSFFKKDTHGKDENFINSYFSRLFSNKQNEFIVSNGDTSYLFWKIPDSQISEHFYKYYKINKKSAGYQIVGLFSYSPLDRLLLSIDINKELHKIFGQPSSVKKMSQ